MGQPLQPLPLLSEVAELETGAGGMTQLTKNAREDLSSDLSTHIKSGLNSVHL